VTDHRKAGAAARRSQGIEGPALRFRGAESAPVPKADDAAARCPAGQRPSEDRAGGQPGRLSPSHGEDRRPDEPMPVVEVDGERDVIPAIPEEIGCELGGRRGPVDPAGERQWCLCLWATGRGRATEADLRTSVRSGERKEIGSIVEPSSEAGFMESSPRRPSVAERPRKRQRASTAGGWSLSGRRR
jgi:hypothetical protein